MEFAEFLRSCKLTIAEAYELVIALSQGSSKATRAGWVAFRDGYRPQDAYGHWGVADELSQTRWDALTAWYSAIGPAEQLAQSIQWVREYAR